MQEFPVRENPPTTLEPPPEMFWTKKTEKGNPQEWIGVLIFCLKTKVFGIQLVKQNKPNGQMTAAPEGGCKHYGVGEEQNYDLHMDTSRITENEKGLDNNCCRGTKSCAEHNDCCRGTKSCADHNNSCRGTKVVPSTTDWKSSLVEAQIVVPHIVDWKLIQA